MKRIRLLITETITVIPLSKLNGLFLTATAAREWTLFKQILFVPKSFTQHLPEGMIPDLFNYHLLVNLIPVAVPEIEQVQQLLNKLLLLEIECSIFLASVLFHGHIVLHRYTLPLYISLSPFPIQRMQHEINFSVEYS